MQKIVQPGSKVTIHYVCKFEDGKVVEESKKEGLTFISGRRAVIKGLDDGILGMQEGEHRKIIVAAVDAYGEYHNDLISEVPKTHLPEGVEPRIGSVHQMTTQKGKTVHMKVLEVREQTVIVDMNHPMAGKNLIFEVVVMKIE